MIVLALDTSTPTVVAGLVELPAEPGGQPTELASRRLPGGRQHGELLMPAVLAVCAQAGRTLDAVDAVVCGTGPGPFTGLRVGMVTAAALGDALRIGVYGVCSLDGVAAAAAAPVGAPLLVVTDARRREVYWAAYDAAGHRIAGPNIDIPAALAEHIEDLQPMAAAGAAAGELDLPVLDIDAPTPAGLVAVAAPELRASTPPEPFAPQYLRRPDAVAATTRKRVTA